MKTLCFLLPCLIADLAFAQQADYEANPVPAVGQNAADVRGEKGSGHPRVLFLGNSITRHGPKPSIGWTNDFGMAASSVDKDYVHVLAAKIKAQAPSASFALANVAGTLERKFLKGLDLEQDFGWMRDWKPDYVVMFFGANCPKTYDSEADGRFGRAVESLRNFLNADGKTRFVIAEGFYRRPALDAEKKSVAERYGDVFVTMEDVRSRSDVRGRFNHPSDNGMRLIAERLWEHLGPALAKRTDRDAAWPAELVQVTSTLDGTPQPCWYWATEKASTEAVPLIVGLHTWSGSILSTNSYRGACGEAVRRGWAFVGPGFRGPNNKPEACGSEAVVQDVVDAVAYARRRVRIDPKRIYIIGGSGGGHLTLLMAGRHPELWAGCAAFCPITDLARWHAQSLEKHPGRIVRYAKMMEGACGGKPSEKPDEYAVRSPLTHLAKARAAGVPVYIATGIHDGWKGSVPVGHAIRGFNALADEKDRVSEDDIRAIEETQAVPASLVSDGVPDPFYSEKMRIHFRRTSANVRLTIFEGGHGGNFAGGADFLSRQAKGRPADFALPSAGRGDEELLAR